MTGSQKKVGLSARPVRKDPDRWVQEGAEKPVAIPAPSEPVPEPVVAEKMKRLTIDLPETLHQDFKIHCTKKGLKMADVVREMLETLCK
jgi:hypothetical protein